MKNKGAVIGLVIIVGALAFSAVAFKNNLVNAVPFSEAIRATDSDVQVMGAPIPGTMNYDSTLHALRFTMRDSSGQTLPVIYKGPKPDDLDSAMSKAVAINAQGTYDPAQHAFVADNLLVKCPSKYQGQGTTERSYGK
ncbi:MAG: cytochrome c maturation protein CcmE [Janthinobacterium lividum]